jgi:hypothetical protein
VYGGKIVNDGKGREGEWKEEFEGCYDEQEGLGGTRLFLMLWLHAHRYTFKHVNVETPLPQWALK